MPSNHGKLSNYNFAEWSRWLQCCRQVCPIHHRWVDFILQDKSLAGQPAHSPAPACDSLRLPQVPNFSLKTLTFLSLLRTARTLLNLLSLTHCSPRPKLLPIYLHPILLNIHANLPTLVRRDYHLPSGSYYFPFPRQETWRWKP